MFVINLMEYINGLFQKLSQLVVNSGGVGAIVDYIGDRKGNVRLPGIMALGYIGAHSENLAMSIITCKVSSMIRFNQT